MTSPRENSEGVMIDPRGPPRSVSHRRRMPSRRPNHWDARRKKDRE
jgi:hypothetical protein